jgi:hypothetical protein
VRASTLRLLTFAITLYASAPSALSHPLPGSTLTFARGDENVELTLTIPVPELIVAQPALVGIGEVEKILISQCRFKVNSLNVCLRT